MPETLSAPVPAAPQAVPAATKNPSPAAGVGSAVPSSAGEIQVIPGAIDHFDDSKVGTPKGDMFSRLNKLAEKEEPIKPAVTEKGTKTAKTTPQTPPPKPAEPAPKGNEAEAVAEPTPEEVTAAAAKPAEKGKVNPWKLYEESKKQKAKLESDLAEARKLLGNEAERKGEVERLTKAEQRAKELEDHIRYVDYSKSQEFQEKYQKPYEKAWTSAMAELKEVTIATADGAERPMTANDMLELVNMPLAKARALATEAFGDMADDVMAQRKEIRGLFDKQASALEEARTKGGEREATMKAESERAHGEIAKQVKEHWTQLNEAITKDEKIGKYFQPIEGDDEANSRLAKGYELVDSAFASNPMDPKLKPEERQEIIKKHVVVRNRAAAFGRLTHLNAKLEARVAELETELKQYGESTPEVAGTRTQGAAVPSANNLEAALSRLDSLATR